MRIIIEKSEMITKLVNYSNPDGQKHLEDESSPRVLGKNLIDSRKPCLTQQTQRYEFFTITGRTT